MSYSIYERVADGQLIGPRFLLWLVKLATHCSATFLVLCFTNRAMLAAVIGGPCILSMVTIRQLILNHRLNVLDKLHDATFSIVPIAGALIFAHDYLGGALLFGACVSVQRVLRTYATP